MFKHYHVPHEFHSHINAFLTCGLKKQTEVILFPIKILEEGAIIGHLFSIYQAIWFEITLAGTLSLWKNVSSFLFSGHLPVRKLARNFSTRDPNSLGRERWLESFRSRNAFPASKSNSNERTRISILRDNELLPFQGARDWSVRPRRRDEILGRRLPSPLRDVHGVSKGQSG